MSDDIGESQRSKGRQESEYGNEQKLEGIVRVVKRPIQAIETPLVWTRRMLNALSNGVKRGKWYSLYDKVYSMLT